jgi:hypothetical protein
VLLAAAGWRAPALDALMRRWRAAPALPAGLPVELAIVLPILLPVVLLPRAVGGKVLLRARRRLVPVPMPLLLGRRANARVEPAVTPPADAAGASTSPARLLLAPASSLAVAQVARQRRRRLRPALQLRLGVQVGAAGAHAACPDASRPWSTRV